MSEISRKQSPPTAVPMSRVTAVGNHDLVRDGRASAGSARDRVEGPDDTFPPSLETTLRSAFSLTTAECRVVKGLLDGLSPREIGEHAGTSINTVNTQLKSVFSKTAVHRQADVIRLCFELQRSVRPRT